MLLAFPSGGERGGRTEHPESRREREAAPAAARGPPRPVDGSRGTRNPHGGRRGAGRLRRVVHGAPRPVRHARRSGPGPARPLRASSGRRLLDMILLDTNVVSELMRPEPAPQVASWVRSRDRRELFMSSITLAEIRYSLARLPNGRRKQTLIDAAG